MKKDNPTASDFVQPEISVIMSVFNGARYLKKSIESILNQSYEDFEYVIIDDGSTDKSKIIIESFKDPRIKLISNKQNIGLAASLNIGIQVSKGKYIARMDCDDVSATKRLENQLEYLIKNPKISGYRAMVRFD